MDKYLRYFEYGKYFTEHGISDFCLLNHSQEFDSHNSIDILRKLHLLELPINVPLTQRNISITLLPYGNEFVLVKSQFRREGDYERKMGRIPRLDRPFQQIFCIFLRRDEIEAYLIEGIPLYSILIDLTRNTNQSSDEYARRRKTESRSQNPYASNFFDNEDLLKVYTEPGRINPIKIPTYTKVIRYIRPQVIQIMRRIAEDRGESSDRFSITSTNKSLDRKSYLELFEQTQMIMWREWGIFTFTLDINPGVIPPVNLNFSYRYHSSYDSVYEKRQDISKRQSVENLDEAQNERLRNPERSSRQIVLSIYTQNDEFPKHNDNAKWIYRLTKKRETKPINLDLKTDSLRVTRVYLQWLTQFLELYYLALEEIFGSMQLGGNGLNYWKHYLDGVNNIGDLFQKVTSNSRTFTSTDEEIKSVIWNLKDNGKGLGQYFEELERYYREYSEQRRGFIYDQSIRITNSLKRNDFHSANLMLSDMNPLEIPKDLRRDLKNRVQEFVDKNNQKFITRYGNVSYPTKVHKGRTFGLAVELGLTPSSEKSPLISISENTPAHEANIDVLISFNEKDFEYEGDYVRNIKIDRSQGSDPTLFRLRALEEGQKQVKFDFFHQGSYKGQSIIELNILEHSNNISDNPANNSASSLPINLIDLTTVNSPDITIYLRKNDNGYEYRLYTYRSHLDIKLETVVGQINFSALNIQEYIQRIYEELNEKINPDVDDKIFFEDVNSIGTQLYDKLFPEELKKLWWDKLRDITHSILIISDETWVPWELIKPYKIDEDGKIWEDDFLCERYQLSRWLQGSNSLPHKIDFTNLKLIVSSSMKDLDGDTEGLNLFNPNELKVEELSASLENVFSLLIQGGFDAMHFGCHSTYDANNPDYSYLELDDGEKLQPRHVSGIKTSFGADHPLVFLNACASGRTAASLTGVGGWAGQLLSAGVSAFIGSIWEIDNQSATPFARHFYENLLTGMTIGKAAQEARLSIKRVGDPSWLSYIIYANPESQTLTEKKKKQIAEAKELVESL